MNKIKLIFLGLKLFVLGYVIRHTENKMNLRYDEVKTGTDAKLIRYNNLLFRRQNRFKALELQFAKQMKIVVKGKNN